MIARTFPVNIGLTIGPILAILNPTKLAKLGSPRMPATRVTSEVLSVSFLGVIVALITIHSFANPIFTWDTVAYVASVLAGGIGEPGELHSATYAYLEQRLSAGQYAILTTGEYAEALAANAGFFYDQLGMYMIKPLYVSAARTLTTLGIDPLTSLQLLSVLPGLALSCLLYVWLRENGSLLQALALTLLFIVASRLIDTSRVPIPDNLSALLIFAGIYLYLVKDAQAVSLSLLVLAVGVRTNNIVFVGLFLSAVIWNSWRQHREFNRRALVLPAVALLLSLLGYVAITTYYEQSWWRLFYHTFVQPQVDLTAFDLNFDMTVYFDVLNSSLQRFLASGEFINTSLSLYLLIMLLGMRGRWRITLKSLIRPTHKIQLPEICLLSLLVLAAFIILFPQVASWDRFFIPFYGIYLVLAHQTTVKSDISE